MGMSAATAVAARIVAPIRGAHRMNVLGEFISAPDLPIVYTLAAMIGNACRIARLSHQDHAWQASM